MKRLDPSDAPEVQALFDRCADFFTLTDGAPADADAAARELETIIPGRTSAETYCLAVYSHEALVAFLHLTENHPRPHEATT